ncbi:hypothetical protein [Streptomyces sp. NPDC058664]|uniref:hypothetical protein n=1 Tax=unclassified Streptomyces TaxID=2593676 RepID=UPI0036528F42
MTTAPSLVLRGRGESVLRYEGGAGRVTLRRADRERRIPLAAIALVRAEGRSVAIALTAPEEGEPTVYRVVDVSEAAALAFADVVNAALPGTRVSDGASHVTTFALLAAPPPRARTRLPAGAVAVSIAVVALVTALVVTSLKG